LTRALGDASRVHATVSALATTDDAALAPLLAALSRSGDKSVRLLATTALRGIEAEEATAALRQRLAKDPSMGIRAEALLALLARRAMSDDQLLEALDIPDEPIRSIAARELLRRKRAEEATGVLEKLAASGDAATAAMAKMALLGAGHRQHLPDLRALITRPQTSDDLVAMILGQIAQERIAAAAPLAAAVADSDRPRDVRLRAYRALAAVAPDAAATIHQAITKSRRLGFRVRLLRMLASVPGSAAQLASLQREKGAVGALARLEVSPAADAAKAASKAAREAVATGHPIVVEYVLNRAERDAAAGDKPPAVYVPALLAVMRSAPASGEMGAAHMRAARAVTLLVDIGTAEAVAGVKQRLAGRYSSAVRAAAAGLLKAKGAAAGDLARSLLDSPYPELANDAVLMLGRLGDKTVEKRLADLVAAGSRHGPTMAALASWYLLKMRGQAADAARALANGVK
jgi:HEAT repeat protein